MKNIPICTILLPLLLLLTPKLFQAQTPEPNDLVITTTDTTGGGVVPRRLAATADGGFITAGSDGLHGYLSKTSSCGKELWVRKYLLGDETDLNSVVELPSGELVAVGNCWNCAPGDTTQKALVIKTDAAGQLLQDTTLGNLNYNAQATDVVLTAEGKIALCGQAVFATFLSPNNVFLAVFNTALQLDFLKTHNHFYYDNGHALTQTSDGGFVLAGRSIPAIVDPPQAQLFRLDANGNLLWKYTAPHLNGQFNDVVQAADGSIVAYGDRMVDTVSGRDVYLVILDETTGALLTEKTYGSLADDTGKSLELTKNGYLAGAVYGTPSQTGNSVRNWVFWLDNQFEVQDEYFRDGFLFGHFLVNALPLSADGRAFAYLSRLVFFSDQQIQFFKRTFYGNEAALAQAPANFQLVPRDLNTNRGEVVFSGSVSDPAAFDAMQLDVYRNGAPHLSFTDATPANFEFKTEIPAELAEYTFRLLGVKNQQRYLEAEACDVVAGDVYLIQGQSNGLAALPFDPGNTIDHAYRHHTTPFVRNFGLKTGPDSLLIWHKETGELGDYNRNHISGQWGLILGKNIVDDYGIPVAVINGAISGIAIDDMMPNPNNHADPNTGYGRYLQRVEKSGLRDHLRGIIMFQGETNAAGGFWDSADKYFSKFVKLDNAWKQDFPAIQQRYLFQIRPGAYWAGATLHTSLQVAEAQRRIAENLPDWQIMSATGMNHDSTHYFYPNGYERAGHDIYRLVARDLYSVAETENIHPPTVDSLRFSNCDHREITLYLRYQADSYNWTPGWENDFYFEGSKESLVTAGQIAGNTVVLTLSEAPKSAFTGLSYTSHPGGDQAPVKNANGIGMLLFYNLPVAPYGLSASIATTPLSCFGGNNGTATLTISGGTPPYQFAWPGGQTGTQVGNLAAGVYTLTITDAKGCTVSASATVSQPPALNVTGTVVPASCFGSADGAILLTASGGTPGYTYLWSTGATTAVVIGLPAGSYTATVTDANGCTTVSQPPFNVSEPPPATGSLEQTTCAGDIVVIANQSFVSPGQYQVQLISASGCDSLLSLTLNAYPTPQTTDTVLLCAGETYTLPNGTVVDQSGNFNLTLTSAAGCDSLVALRVEIFEPIAVQAVQILPDSGMGSGSITVTPKGGLPGYTYAWSNGASGPVASGLSPGTYTVTISDALGCTAVFEFQMIVGTSQALFGLEAQLYPNPCSAYLNLSIPEISDAGTYRILVTDLTGKTALPPASPTGDLSRLETALLPPGTYALRLLQNGRLVWSGMFVKN